MVKLDQLKEIKECEEEQANKLLKVGYSLIKIVKTRSFDDERLIYCLGK